MSDSQEKKKREFVVYVHTGSVKRAGTDANVTIEMIDGEGNSTGPRKLSKYLENNFERDRVDEFKIESEELTGDIERIVMSHDSSGIGLKRFNWNNLSAPGWFLNKVVIEEENTGNDWEFFCNRWLSKKKDDETSRELFCSVRDSFQRLTLKEKNRFRVSGFFCFCLTGSSGSSRFAENGKHRFRFRCSITLTGVTYPFAVITYGHQKGYTSKSNSPNPFFLNATTTFNREEGKRTIRIKFIHAAPPLDQQETIGETKLSLSKIGDNDEWEGWLPLKRKGNENTEEEKVNKKPFWQFWRPRSKSKPVPPKVTKGFKEKKVEKEEKVGKKKKEGKEEKKEEEEKKAKRERRKTLSDVPSDKKSKSKNRHSYESPKSNLDSEAPMIHVKISKRLPPPLVDKCYVFDTPDILDKIHSGDCVTFYGRSALATVITNTQKYPYSHVTIALRMKDPDRLWLVESTQNANNVKDQITGEVRTGVTVFDVKERLGEINAQAAWHVPLREPLSESEEKKLIDKALELHKEEIQYDKKQLLPFLVGFKNEEDLKELFCSELASQLLREIGRLPPDTNPSMTTPDMLVNSECYRSLGSDIDLRILRQQKDE